MAEETAEENEWNQEREEWAILLEGAQTGILPGREAARRFWLLWMKGEGLLTCPYCGEEFGTPEELAEHDKWEC